MRFKRLSVLRSALAIGLARWLVAMMDVAIAQDAIYVTKMGSSDPDGSLNKPYHLVEVGIVRTLTSPANTVVIEAGTYYETFTTDTPCTLKATGGTVTIGKLDYQASTTLEIITLNTHLAGDEVFMPSWQDYERADDIADFLSGPNPRPDVVGFQEIWDEDLFFGGDGANGILPRSGYPYGDHGDVESDVLNSGCALMSRYPLIDFLQADYTDSDREARANQMAELRDVINAYRTAHPSHVAFAMGDFNVYGEETEYDTTLIPQVGIGAGGREADRNSPGFVFGSSQQWTLCDCNPLAMYFDEDTVSGRLDYIFYFPSLDGSVEVVPKSVEVLPFLGWSLTEDGLTTNQSSDHWGVHGEFKLIRP